MSDNLHGLKVYEYEKNKKIREIITYSDDEEGSLLREKHEEINKIILEKFSSNKNSYAYKKNNSTKKAFFNHKNSNLFIKLDIKSFFESISYNKFTNVVELDEALKQEIQCCFYNDHLPIGFVTSPKLSDMYLYSFDNSIEKYLNSYKNLYYSRYCDDILISSKTDNFGTLHSLYAYIQKELEKYGLVINDKKVREFDLSKDTAVTFLGLNLSKNGKDTKITLSKPFILKTLDLLEQAYDAKNQLEAIHSTIKKDYRIIKYNQKNDIIDDQLIKKNNELFEKYKQLKKKCSNLKSVIKSRVGYIRYNSDFSYEKFLKKHLNKFGFKWGEVRL